MPVEERSTRTNIMGLVKDLDDLGPVEFRRQYVRPALIGIGHAPDTEEEEDFAGRTMIVNLAPPDSTRGSEEGSITGMVFIIPYRTTPIRLGCIATNNDIVVADYSISAVHCELRWTAFDRLVIADIGARNQVLVNKVLLGPRQMMRLKGGESIVLGRLVFRFAQPERLLQIAELGPLAAC